MAWAATTPTRTPTTSGIDSSNTAFRPNPAGDTPRTESSVTARRRRSNQSEADAATSPAPARAPNPAIGQMPPPTEVWIAWERSVTNGRCECR